MKQIEVEKLTPRIIILAMTAGLRKRWVEIRMETFGQTDKGVCFGCAATNTLCQLVGVAFNPSQIKDERTRSRFLKISRSQLDILELAIDWLRRGNIVCANQQLARIGIGEIINPKGIHLGCLGDYYTDAHLQQYDKLAKDQVC